MNAAPSSHPSAMILELFDEGRLDAGGAAAVLAHLDTCPACRHAVMTRPPGSLLRRSRAAQPTGATMPEMSVEQATITTGDLPPALPKDVPLDLPPELRDHKQYRVERELGRGGMGVVFLAHDMLMNRPVVLKVVNSVLVRDPGMRERFLREIQLAASLRHPNVATAHHAEQIGQLLVLVMEYAPGETLEQMMFNRKGRPLPVVNACAYAQQIARGLQHAFERGLVHRDIKPANLILTVTAKAHLVRILDFGLGKARSDNEASTAGLTGTGAMMGTPAYMAPEQSEDAARADIRADIYSLGCTLYFLLAGHPPFTAKSIPGLLKAHASQEAVPLSQLRGDVSAALSDVVARMMAKEASRRYAKPEEVVKALAPFLAGGKKLEPVAKPSARPESETRVTPGGPTRVGKLDPSTVGVGVKPGRAIPPTVLERPSRPEQPKDRTRNPAVRVSPVVWLGVAGVALAVVLVVVLWAGVFRVKTGEGTLVLETDDPTAEVFVDGERVSVTWGSDGKTVEFAAKPGTRKVEVRRGDVVMLGEEVEVWDGKRRILTARLVADKGKRPDSGRITPQETRKEAPNTGKQDEDKLLPGERSEDSDYQIGSETRRGRCRVLTLDIGRGEKMECVRISKGKFFMGSPKEEEKRTDNEERHEVEITRDFYLGKYAVTQAQYEAVTGKNPSWFSAGSGGKERVEGLVTSRFPVEQVSWEDAVEFCEKLRRKTGRNMCLPREAEWEYACRAGTTTPFSFGGRLNGDLANCDGNYPYGTETKGVYYARPVTVGTTYLANPWGLYNMHGNVCQWCEDWYGDYKGLDSRDPVRKEKDTADGHVLRGGSWFDDPWECRAAYRAWGTSTTGPYLKYFGFRVCIRLD